eukprot:m.20755 g.20755  ORF g.20755 m.20755 type:complete len:573 (+) comp6261_c0_seq1:157-1875(+)
MTLTPCTVVVAVTAIVLLTSSGSGSARAAPQTQWSWSMIDLYTRCADSLGNVSVKSADGSGCSSFLRRFPDHVKLLGRPLGNMTARTTAHGVALTREFSTGTRVFAGQYISPHPKHSPNNNGFCVFWSNGNITGNTAHCPDKNDATYFPLFGHTPGVSKTCNAISYGAVGDNVTEDTDAVRAAVKACSSLATNDVQNTVVLPAGKTFLLRPIQLFSNMAFLVEGNIAAWRAIDSWPNSTTKTCPATPYKDPHPLLVPRKESLLWAENATNLVIGGSGVVDGQGWRWWPLRKESEYWHNCRPKLLELGRVSPYYSWGVDNVLIENITFKDSAFWTTTVRASSNLVYRNVTIFTTGCGYSEAPNTDGFNVQGENILIENCRVRNGDDCVPIFPPSRNVTVNGLHCECGNGIVPIIWTANSVPGFAGNITDVSFNNVDLKGTNTGCHIKSLPSFLGFVSNVTYKNVVMHGVTEGAAIDLYDQSESLADDTPAVGSANHITYENVVGYDMNKAGFFKCGPTNPCHDLVLRNVTLHGTDGKSLAYQCEHATGSFSAATPQPSCLSVSEKDLAARNDA